MKISVAKHSGFCYGVKKAVNIATDHFNVKKTFTYGDIIHNEDVIKKLEQHNIKSIDDLKKAENGNLIIRAHGVGKQVYEQAKKYNINIIDATCPYVKEIHSIVEKFYHDGYKIIIIGDKNHPEIIGINGWCENNGIIVDNTNLNLSNLSISDKICLVCQTTYKRAKFEAIKKELLNTFETIVVHDTICSATKNRQTSAIALAKEVDLMLVVGGKNSSNTNKLYELCKEHTQTLFIQNEKDFNKSDLKQYTHVGIVGGASTPDWIINNIITKLEK